MKTRILILFMMCSFAYANAQTNEEIAGVYITKSEENFNNSRIAEAQVDFNKAMKLLDTIKKASMAKLGTLIEFGLKNYKQSRSYAQQYFLLEKNKKASEYQQLLELYVTLQELIEKEELEFLNKEKIRIAQENAKRWNDSLKTVWQNQSDKLILKFNYITPFDKNGIAVFKKEEFFGLLNDQGAVLLEADTYKDYRAYEGYVLLLNQKLNPTKVYSYNTSSKEGFMLPEISGFNPLSTNFGSVMLPRGNGKVVAYPNNSLKVMVFDLTSKTVDVLSDEKDVLKELRKTDKIEKSNNDGQVRIGGEWYNFGGHLGGGIYPLFNSNYSLFGFLCGIDGKVLKADQYNRMGAFFGEKAQVQNADTTTWVNQNGTELETVINPEYAYAGISKLVQVTGGYQIHQEIGGKKYIVLGENKLVMLEDYLKENPFPTVTE